jgi:preprotein translocase subunit YajC
MNIIDGLFSSVVSNAYADGAGAPPPQSNMFLPFFLVVFILFLYLTVWRPQNKRAKELRDLLASLAKGDEVVTAGGLIGKITKLSDSYVVLSVSDTTEITMQKSSIVNVLPKGTLKSI